MEIILVILLAVTAALAAWNIRLAAQARRERGGLRQSLENLEVRMGEISGTLTGSNQSIAEAKAAQGDKERTEVQHRKDMLAAQEKAAVSGREIQESLNRLGEALSALQAAQREGLQTVAADSAKALQGVAADSAKSLQNVAVEWAKKLDGLDLKREETARSGAAGMEKIIGAIESMRGGMSERESAAQDGSEKVRQSLAAQIQSIEGAWNQTVESLRTGITENREGLAETVAQGREAAAKALEESVENHVGRTRELLEGVRSGAVESRAQTLIEVEALLNRFEKRVADYLEENALKVQEVLLESLDRFPEESTATQILARTEEGRESHGG